MKESLSSWVVATVLTHALYVVVVIIIAFRLCLGLCYRLVLQEACVDEAGSGIPSVHQLCVDQPLAVKGAATVEAEAVGAGVVIPLLVWKAALGIHIPALHITVAIEVILRDGLATHTPHHTRLLAGLPVLKDLHWRHLLVHRCGHCCHCCSCSTHSNIEKYFFNFFLLLLQSDWAQMIFSECLLVFQEALS